MTRRKWRPLFSGKIGVLNIRIANVELVEVRGADEFAAAEALVHGQIRPAPEEAYPGADACEERALTRRAKASALCHGFCCSAWSAFRYFRYRINSVFLFSSFFGSSFRFHIFPQISPQARAREGENNSNGKGRWFNTLSAESPKWLDELSKITNFKKSASILLKYEFPRVSIFGRVHYLW